MKKLIALSILLLLFISSFFIPVQETVNVRIKSPFLNIYTILSTPEKWEQWLPAFHQTNADSFTIHKAPTLFTVKAHSTRLEVKRAGNYFDVSESSGSAANNYLYAVTPAKTNTTAITVTQKTSLFKHLFSADSLTDTHIYAFKHFIETDSLYYGYAIFKKYVPDGYLIVIHKRVPESQKFSTAASSLTTLKQFVKEHKLQQTQPLIAQFQPASKDSVQVNVGFFINKETVSQGPVSFVHMPRNAPLYAIHYTGGFNHRQQGYNSLQQYFTDHLYQLAVAPFESYLNNKLPASEKDSVNIQINFPTYF